jgi:RNA polymerase sigma factor (sigma-70 family)
MTTRATTTVGTTAAPEVATTSAPHEPLSSNGGRPDRAAAARTEELYSQFGRTVGGLCRALLRDASEAEDAAQQTFLSAHRALLNGSRPLEPAAWLAAIARNECWARIKTRMREPLPSEALETRVSGANDPVVEALRRADLAALWAAIDALPPVQRDALLLREFGGLSYEELAAALSVSEPAVESLLFRARRRLRVQLRAAFAALTGASWLEALARLVTSGGAPAAAAKVAALGVGAAAIGSGAAVVPQVFDNHHPSQPASTPLVVRPAHKPSKPVHVEHVATPPPVTLVPVVAQPPVQKEHRSGRRDESGPGPSRVELRAVDDHSGPGGGGGSGDGETVTTVPTATVAVATVPTATGGDGRDGGSGSDGGGGGSDGGSIDGGGDGGH